MSNLDNVIVKTPLELALDSAIEAIRAKFQPRIDAITAAAQQMQDDFNTPGTIEAIINVDFEVNWIDKEFSLYLPRISMEEKHIALHLPEITSHRQHIAFSWPETRMVMKVVGKYPEIRWPKIEWKDIKIEVPEITMVRQDIYFDLPSVTMRRQDFFLHLPKLSMENTRIVLRLPEITVRNVKMETEKLAEDGRRLSLEGNLISQEMDKEMKEATQNVISQYHGENSNNNRNQVSSHYDQAILKVDQAINSLVAQKCDPIRIPTDTGEVNLRKTLDELIVEKGRALSDIDQVFITAT